MSRLKEGGKSKCVCAGNKNWEKERKKHCWQHQPTKFYSITPFLLSLCSFCTSSTNLRYTNIGAHMAVCFREAFIFVSSNFHTSRCQLIVTTWFQCVKKLLWVPMGSQIRHLWPKEIAKTRSCAPLKSKQ